MKNQCLSKRNLFINKNYYFSQIIIFIKLLFFQNSPFSKSHPLDRSYSGNRRAKTQKCSFFDPLSRSRFREVPPYFFFGFSN